jgi:hypothetical protein
MASAFSGVMLPASEAEIIRFDVMFRPRLLVIVDAEEEFDWSAPFQRENCRVSSISSQKLAHTIFDRYGVKPTYLVDYPVANQELGYRPLRDLYEAGRCGIGAQLHSWVTPPFEEEVSDRNSFANNLSPDLERRKIHELTEKIVESFALHPTIYRAGRFGAGPATSTILDQLQYEIDCSVYPGPSSTAAAPSFLGAPSHPFWLTVHRSILELPVTVSSVGLIRGMRQSALWNIESTVGRALKIPAVLSRLGLLERIRLTPEGTTIEEAKRLTKTMIHDGYRIFVLSYHSPSLVPGNTPYVRDQAELKRFLEWIENYLEYFVAELAGRPATPSDVLGWARNCELRGPRNDPWHPGKFGAADIS